MPVDLATITYLHGSRVSLHGSRENYHFSRQVSELITFHLPDLCRTGCRHMAPRDSAQRWKTGNIWSGTQPGTDCVMWFMVHCRLVATADPAGFRSHSTQTDQSAPEQPSPTPLEQPVPEPPSARVVSTRAASTGAANARPDSFSSFVPWPLRPVSSSPLAMLTPFDEKLAAKVVYSRWRAVSRVSSLTPLGQVWRGHVVATSST